MPDSDLIPFEPKQLKTQLMLSAAMQQALIWFVIALVVVPVWFKCICLVFIARHLWRGCKLYYALPADYFWTSSMLSIAMGKREELEIMKEKLAAQRKKKKEEK